MRIASFGQGFQRKQRDGLESPAFEQDTDTIRRIQKAARERGGIVMAVAPVMETLHDHDNVIRQYFPNGALLEISKNDSTGVVTYKGEEVRHYDNVTFPI